MIKIVKGVYGYLNKNGSVIPKTEKDGPFELSEEKEARLVGLGVAVYVNEPAKVPEKEPGQDEAAEDIARAEAEPSLEEMTVKELRELGKEQYGLTFKVGTTKAEMIQAIQEKWPQDTEDDEAAEDDGEALPEFDPSEAVE